MHDAAEQHASDDREQQADHGHPTVAIGRHRRVALRPRRDADRGVVEPQHQRITLDAAGGQPVSGARSRRDPHLERAVRAADDFLAGEAVTLQRIGDEMAFRIVQRQGPEPRRRRHAADHHVAAAVQRSFAVVGRRRERHAVAGADRQFAAARNRGARIGIDLGGAGSRPRGPCADGERAEIGAARRGHPRRAEADRGGDDQRQQGEEDQPHGQFLRGAGAAGSPGAAAAKLSGNATRGRRHRLGRFDRIAGRGLARGLRRVVEHFLHAHQNVGAALGEDRRRSRLGLENFRRGVGGDRAAAPAAAWFPCRCPGFP